MPEKIINLTHVEKRFFTESMILEIERESNKWQNLLQLFST
jgi:hypothetical protein